MRRAGVARRTFTVGVVLVQVVAACSAADVDTGASAVVATTAPVESVATTLPSGPAIGITGVSFGGVLTDENSRTMYVFRSDETGLSSCYDECAATWPPVVAGYVAGNRIDVIVGSATRPDGSQQLTVNGRPVYLFSGDNHAGDINGQGSDDLWFVVGIDGEPITKTGGYGY